tara:strand:- start:750 stop:974 length:225 start_codon:yes stop_codon:yes gene_type:complete
METIYKVIENNLDNLKNLGENALSIMICIFALGFVVGKRLTSLIVLINTYLLWEIYTLLKKNKPDIQDKKFIFF